MFKKLLIITSAVRGGLLNDENENIMNLLRNVSPHSLKSHPVVESTATCSTTVARMKKGPANIPEQLYWGTQ